MMLDGVALTHWFEALIFQDTITMETKMRMNKLKTHSINQMVFIYVKHQS